MEYLLLLSLNGWIHRLARWRLLLQNKRLVNQRRWLEQPIFPGPSGTKSDLSAALQVYWWLNQAVSVWLHIKSATTYCTYLNNTASSTLASYADALWEYCVTSPKSVCVGGYVNPSKDKLHNTWPSEMRCFNDSVGPEVENLKSIKLTVSLLNLWVRECFFHTYLPRAANLLFVLFVVV